jgi:hypothetical protein
MTVTTMVGSPRLAAEFEIAWTDSADVPFGIAFVSGDPAVSLV